jgi:GNAT superfamily N-acetyltransferase
MARACSVSFLQRQSMSTVTIRPARAEDKDAVLAFTQKTWDWGDYIQHVWDDWLAKPNGELALAEIGRQPVGIAMTLTLSPGEGWLQGLRVHPDYRRQGVARELTAYQLDWLRQHSVPVVRLAVNCRNLASQTHTAKSGFRRATTFCMVEQSAKDLMDSGPAAETLGLADADAAWGFIEQSPTLRAAAGLWENSWAWHRLTRGILDEQIGKGYVFGVRSGEQWGALAIGFPNDRGQELGYIDGAGPALEHLARALSGRAKRAGAEFNAIAVPPVPGVISALHLAGYPAITGGAGMYIYELDL